MLRTTALILLTLMAPKLQACHSIHPSIHVAILSESHFSRTLYLSYEWHDWHDTNSTFNIETLASQLQAIQLFFFWERKVILNFRTSEAQGLKWPVCLFKTDGYICLIWGILNFLFEIWKCGSHAVVCVPICMFHYSAVSVNLYLVRVFLRHTMGKQPAALLYLFGLYF